MRIRQSSQTMLHAQHRLAVPYRLLPQDGPVLGRAEAVLVCEQDGQQELLLVAAHPHVVLVHWNSGKLQRVTISGPENISLLSVSALQLGTNKQATSWYQNRLKGSDDAV
jgi:hypothetical protein